MENNKQNRTARSASVRRLTGLAMLTAIVVVLQLLGSFIKLGPVSVSLVLVPIAVAAALYGPGAGAFMGGVFSVVVLLQPDTAFFYNMSMYGTIVTVLCKGVLAGLLSGLLYRALEKENNLVAVILAALVCPLVNTGLFLLGCRIFFWDGLTQLAGGASTFVYIITTMIGFNFLAELGVNLVCVPAIQQIVKAVSKK